MVQCSRCGTPTEIDVGHYASVCEKCSKAQTASDLPATPEVRAILFEELIAASERARAATEYFTKVTGNIPSGLPHPDGTQRIHNASRKLTAARNEMIKAHSRLNDYLNFGIVPEDLKAGR
jgi:hypothetical protein